MGEAVREDWRQRTEGGGGRRDQKRFNTTPGERGQAVTKYTKLHEEEHLRGKNWIEEWGSGRRRVVCFKKKEEQTTPCQVLHSQREVLHYKVGLQRRYF